MRRLGIGILAAALSGCAANRVYVDPAKTAGQTHADEDACRAKTASVAEDQRQKALHECMSGMGYAAVSKAAAGKVKGFSKAWVNRDVDFKVYEAVFVGPVDFSKVSLKDPGLPDILDNLLKPTREEAAELAGRLRDDFVKFLSGVVQVETKREALAGRKAIALEIALEDIHGADPGANIAAQFFLHTSISSAQAAMSCTLSDAASGASLAKLEDKHSPNSFTDDNVTMLGTEGFERWTGAHRILEAWANRLAAFLAAKRGQPYKSPFIKKVL